MTMSSKGQIAYEFLLMLFVFTVTFTVWIALSARAQEDLRWQHEERVINDLALQLQDDLYFAAQLPEGFTRTLALPGAIVDKEYALTFHEGAGDAYLAITSNDHLVEKALPAIVLPGNVEEYVAGKTLIITNEGSLLKVESP